MEELIYQVRMLSADRHVLVAVLAAVSVYSHRARRVHCTAVDMHLRLKW